MRKIDKKLRYENIPRRLTDAKAEASLKQILSDGNATKIKDDIYKGIHKNQGIKKSEVKDCLNKFYHDKCAYCESFNNPEIEHYRPKGSVAEDATHSGYYWLCYEWSNLLPSCHHCNTVKGKINQFPIAGKRVTEPPLDRKAFKIDSPEMLLEQPLLLHPELEDPADYLAFETANDGIGVSIKGKDPTGRGEQTIKICNLNRDYLRLERKAFFCDIAGLINNFFKSYMDGRLNESELIECLNKLFDQLFDNAKNEKLPHTLLRKYAVSDINAFQNIIVVNVATEIHTLIVQAFLNYKQNIRYN